MIPPTLDDIIHMAQETPFANAECKEIFNRSLRAYLKSGPDSGYISQRTESSLMEYSVTREISLKQLILRLRALNESAIDLVDNAFKSGTLVHYWYPAIHHWHPWLNLMATLGTTSDHQPDGMDNFNLGHAIRQRQFHSTIVKWVSFHRAQEAFFENRAGTLVYRYSEKPQVTIVIRPNHQLVFTFTETDDNRKILRKLDLTLEPHDALGYRLACVWYTDPRSPYATRPQQDLAIEQRKTEAYVLDEAYAAITPEGRTPEGAVNYTLEINLQPPSPLWIGK